MASAVWWRRAGLLIVVKDVFLLSTMKLRVDRSIISRE